MKIEKEIYSNVFYGFYESIFCNSDEFIDLENEKEYDLISNYPFLNEKELSVNYEYENFTEYQKDISNKFSKEYINLIENELPYHILENKNYLLELKDFELYSPKYYNYNTDHISIFINTNYKTLQLIKDYVLSLNDMENYIYKKNKSYDGFISFLSNDIKEWINKPIENYEINEISVLFDNIIIQNDLTFELNYNVYENINKYEYVYPIVNYKDFEMDLYDFEKGIKNYLKTLKQIYN